MLDSFPKFIIETDAELGDCIILAKCKFHKDLVTNPNNVKGGGWWVRESSTNTFTLHGSSEDFGKANVEDIEKCIKNKKVFSSPSLVRNFTDDFKFRYQYSDGLIIDI